MSRLIIKTFALCALLFSFTSISATQAQDASFSKTTIDFGVVVSDLEKSIAFYTDVVGFKRAGNFTVTPQIANDAGLTKVTRPITIEKLKLGDDKSATTLKLMQIQEAKPKKSATEYIHSSLGMSYMTVYVTDTTAALARAAKHGAKPLKKGPVDLGGGKMFLTLLKDPDGNFVELVGPAK
jgi:lactoylglutathione lyase